MEFQLPSYVLYCLNTLESHGFEAWCVGGAVRDHIMGKRPFDYDITTNARPEKIIEIFPKTVPTGLQHGTVTVVTDGGNVEITTYRADGEYSDHRTPDSVVFQETVDKDLSRRDFTMNAICYNPKKGFYDPENGIEDIKNGIIRAIGNPVRRFSEDALRIMRAFRFSAQLGFTIEENTAKAAVSLRVLLKDISVERILAELKRALSAKFATNTAPLLKSGAFKYLGFNFVDFPQHFERFPEDFDIRFACLCHISGVDPEVVLKNMKSDNITVINTKWYYWLLNQPMPTSKPEIKMLLKKVTLPSYLEVIFEIYSLSGVNTQKQSVFLKEIIENKEPYLLSMLDIRGIDIIELGFFGKGISEKLEYLLDEVIKDPTLNQKDKLIEKLK